MARWHSHNRLLLVPLPSVNPSCRPAVLMFVQGNE